MSPVTTKLQEMESQHVELFHRFLFSLLVQTSDHITLMAAA
jgi:hypothetical protein